MYRTSSERTPREFNVLSPIKPLTELTQRL
uniref:Uncharacterized protein n=1 Tax=Anguilla anguilla TaxID=7936 RepID=A0A0E9SX42_ANGAN